MHKFKKYIPRNTLILDTCCFNLIAMNILSIRFPRIPLYYNSLYLDVKIIYSVL